MNNKSKKYLSAMLVLAITLGLLAAVPMTAGAATLNTQGTATYTIQTLANQINDFNHGGNGTLKAAVSNNGNTLTITGNVTNAKKSLHMVIMTGWKVVWRANYTGTVNGGYLITLAGIQPDNSKGTVALPNGPFYFYVEGTIATSGGGAIGARGDLAGWRMNVIVDNGTVSSNGKANAISGENTSVTVRGAAAKVSSESGIAIFVRNSWGNVKVEGGQVSSGQGDASSSSCAISVQGDTHVAVTGGLVFANQWLLHSGIDNAIKVPSADKVAVSDPGVVVVYNRNFGNEFEYRSSTGLTVLPSSARVMWFDGGFEYGTDDFFYVSGITVYETYTVTFNSNGGNAVNKATVKANTKLPEPVPPTKSGYLFDGWYTDAGLTQKYNFDSQQVRKDFTLYAKWTEPANLSLQPILYQITFEPQNGFEAEHQYVTENGTAIKPDDPIKPANGGTVVFDGWYTVPDATDLFNNRYRFDDPVTEGFTLYAKWRTLHHVSFYPNGGSIEVFELLGRDYAIIQSGLILYDSDEYIPVREGYIFDGWYTDESYPEKYAFNEPVTKNFTLYALWTKDPAFELPDLPSVWVNPFIDIFEVDWFYNNVRFSCELGLINGKTPTLFAPNDNLTYAEAVKLAACMHQLDAEGLVTLTGGVVNWYDTYVDYAETNGIINRDYSWNTPATRAGYMEIFANALPDGELYAINTIADGAIPDVPISHPQAAAIYKLYRAGIVQGVDTFHNCSPNSNITRSEVATILTRMMDNSARVDFDMT